MYELKKTIGSTVSPEQVCSGREQADIELKFRAHGQSGNLLTKEKYPTMRKCATFFTALFGSTYLCLSAFSHMIISRSKYRSTITDGHLEACLRPASSSYCPDYATPADSSASHQSMYSVYMNKYMFSIF